MKLILFGTGPFAVPSFQSLVEDSSHEVVALVTRPIADAGKRRKTAENPTRDLGESEGLTVLDPVDANDPEFVKTLADYRADLLVVCDFGQILSNDCLGAAKLGGINLHGSLLPKYRGAAPINWAIYHGDEKTGVTIIHMTPRLDGGPILVTAETAIGRTETAEEIEPRLAELGVQPVHDAIAMLKKWDGESVIGQPQDQALATKAPRLKKSQGQIDWTQSATQIINHIRAFQPWPGTFTHWHGPKQPLRLIVHAASMTTNSSGQIVEPGQVVACDAQLLVLQTGDGMLALDQVQPAGKKKMPIADFLRGRQPAIGDQFE
jgi:methionyl-tRNA formyltransferase